MNAQDALITLDPDDGQQPYALMQSAVTNKADVAVLEGLMRLQMAWDAKKAKRAFDGALAAFQGECPIIVKRKVVPQKNSTAVRYKYAPLDHIVAQVKPLLAKHQFSYQLESDIVDGRIRATCKITHDLGHSTTSSFVVPIDVDSYMTAQQQFASALTFAKRYAFCNAFGILTGDEDNDANSLKKPDDEGTRIALRDQLWVILKPVRGETNNWFQARQWLVDECCMDPDTQIKDLDAAGFRAVIAKATAKLVK